MKPHGLSAYKANLLDRPSVLGMWCPVCGDRATDGHHAVQKGMGGVSKELERRIPILRLCHACHMEHHAGLLHFQWDGGWLWFRSGQPMRDDGAWALYSAHYSPFAAHKEPETFGGRR